jgi:hypothetical protein
VSREAHAGICERRGARIPPATQLGDFKNVGREWRPKGEPELVRVHDFKDKQLGTGRSRRSR